jgi:molybdopterin-binding protein
MTLYEAPQNHGLLEKDGKLTPNWKTYFTNVKNEINLGEAPAPIQEITAAEGIKVTSQRANITIRIISATSGNVTPTINPQVSNGFDGQVITIMGGDDTRTVTLNDGNGLKLSSGITLKEHTNLVLEYNAAKTLWIEKARALT